MRDLNDQYFATSSDMNELLHPADSCPTGFTTHGLNLLDYSSSVIIAVYLPCSISPRVISNRSALPGPKSKTCTGSFPRHGK